MRIAIFGLGCVGTVTTASAAQGNDGSGVDVDSVRVDRIRSGRRPVVEPDMDHLIATAVKSGSLRTTESIGWAV
jgi:UDP-N-acetyl-D-mannosaminuronate dehydrogenase